MSDHIRRSSNNHTRGKNGARISLGDRIMAPIKHLRDNHPPNVSPKRLSSQSISYHVGGPHRRAATRSKHHQTALQDRLLEMLVFELHENG